MPDDYHRRAFGDDDEGETASAPGVRPPITARGVYPLSRAASSDALAAGVAGREARDP